MNDFKLNDLDKNRENIHLNPNQKESPHLKSSQSNSVAGRLYTENKLAPSNLNISLFFQKVIISSIFIMSHIIRIFIGKHHYNWIKNGEARIDFNHDQKRLIDQISLQSEKISSNISSQLKDPLEELPPPPHLSNSQHSDPKFGETESLNEKECKLEIQKEPDLQNLTIEEILNQIRAKADTDLSLDLQHIEKKYGINSLINELPEEERVATQGKLNDIINTAYLVRLLRNKRKVLEPGFLESRLLDSLGYKTVNYTKGISYKEDLYAAFNTIIQSQLEPEDYQASPAEFRQLLQDYALAARLKMADIHEDVQVKKFKIILEHFRLSGKQLKEAVKEIHLTLPDQFPISACPLGQESIRKKFNLIKSKESLMALSRMFDHSEIKSSFRNREIKVSNFTNLLNIEIENKSEESISQLIAMCEKAKEDKELNSLMNLYVKWGSYLKSEIIQGFFDSNEILGEGVCFAICLRILNELQLKPNQDFQNKLTINANDRFSQSLYQVQSLLEINKIKKKVKNGELLASNMMRDLPQINKERRKELLRKTEFERSRPLFDITYDCDEFESVFGKTLKSKTTIEMLQDSNGWMKFHLEMLDGGHAVLMRLDKEREKAWLFDPNIGFFSFEAPDKSFDKAREDCLNCFKDISSVFYPQLYRLEIDQLIPKSR